MTAHDETDRLGNLLDPMTVEFATAWWHWLFFAQPEIPERVTGFGIDSGHHVAEDAPDELAAALGDFFRAGD